MRDMPPAEFAAEQWAAAFDTPDHQPAVAREAAAEPEAEAG